MVCIKQADNIKVEDFRHHLVEEIARPLSTQDEVMRLRLHLLEPFDESENSSYVSHDWAKEKHYQAWIELMLQNEAARKQLFSSNEHAKFIKAIHTFPIVARYTMVYDGKPTIVGLRGFPSVQTIEQASAENQKSPELLEILYGDVVRG